MHPSLSPQSSRRRGLALAWLCLAVLLVGAVVAIVGEQSGSAVSSPVHWIAWAVLATLVLTVLFALPLLGRLDETRRELAASEERHRAVVQHLPDAAILTFDHDLRYTLAEGPALAAAGWDPEAMVGKTLTDLVPAERAEALEAMYRRPLAGETATIDIESLQGRLFSVELTPVRDGSGAITGGMAVARDVTERRRAERQSGEAEERFRQAFDEAPIGMAIVTLDGMYLRVNRSLCQMLGRPSEELIGMTFRDVVHPRDVALRSEKVAESLVGTIDAFEIEQRYLTRDGDMLDAVLSSTLVRDEQGRALYFLAQVVDVTERRQAEERLEFLADHDPLTGLLNRRRFRQELDRQVAHTQRYGNPATLLMLDLDHFKHVNDTLGHAVGDELICRLASAMRHRLRTTDIVARLGGDEFAMLLAETDSERATAVARDLLDIVKRHGVVADGDRAIQVTASIGVAPIDPRRQQTAEELLIDADVAMYDAKDHGRATLAVRDHADGRAQRLHDGVAWADRIRCALANDGFVLYQQPILDLRSGEVARHEILLRMVGENGEHIAPGVFLYVAERFDLIADIDVWVVGRSLELIAEHAAQGRRLDLEVNLSGASITNPRVVEAIEAGLQRTGIDPSCVTFEITETVAIANIDQARRLAERLSALGCRFALDDFGAGFGSFYYLKHLPFDTLKIDGEFVRGLSSSPRDQLLVRSMARLAAELGSETVAEFVGDEETKSLLGEYGIDFAQGYLVGRPEPVASLEAAPAYA